MQSRRSIGIRYSPVFAIMAVVAILVGSVAAFGTQRQASAQTCGTPLNVSFDPPTLVVPPETIGDNTWSSSPMNVSDCGGQTLEASFFYDVDLSGADESLEGVTASMRIRASSYNTAGVYIVYEQVNLDVNSAGTTVNAFALPDGVINIRLDFIFEIVNESTYTGDPLFFAVDDLAVTGPAIPCAPNADFVLQFLAILIAVLRDILAR